VSVSANKKIILDFYQFFEAQYIIVLVFTAFLLKILKPKILRHGILTIVLIFAVIIHQEINAQVFHFDRDFAPQEGLVKMPEKPLREEICLNGSWLFMPVALSGENTPEEIKAPGLPSSENWEETPIKIPSPWNVNGFTNGTGGDFIAYPSYPESWKQVKAGWLKKTVQVPGDWTGKRIILHFEAVAGFTRVFVNGMDAGEHFDSFLPFSFDVTDLATVGEQMEILVWVASGNLLNEPGKYGYRHHVGGSFWGTHIAGIWQDVYLHSIPEVYVEDSYVKPWVDRDELELEITVKNSTGISKKIQLDADIRRWINMAGSPVTEAPEIKWELGESKLFLQHEELVLEPNSSKTIILKTRVEGSLERWSPGHPALYGLLVSVCEKGQKLDNKYTRFGWRQFDIRGKELFLNGEPIVIKGDSWHFMGVPQMSRRYAWSWYRMLKDANANGVRLHAQVFPRFYLEMADEMGICVLDETAIWASDNGPRVDSESYWEACLYHVKGLVLRDRNHPSVFGWSVCNETLPVTKNVMKAPKEYLHRNIREINNWVDICMVHDPSRTWISGDGETPELQIGSPVKDKLPTVIGHYGPTAAYKYWSKHGKPWGIGETGMAYYGSPAQVAKVNGDRAYESQLGRMEGLAAEAFDLIVVQRKNRASYASVFNLAWYGLKPLALGLEDVSRAPARSDGIFFGEYTEGKPGYQPERLGPYCTTFNPGYDPSLPLYEPWPLFDAVKAANADDYRKRENTWKHKTDQTVKIARARSKQGVVWLSAPEITPAKLQFENIGVKFEALSSGERQLILIDGIRPPAAHSALVEELKSVMQNGSTVLIWGADHPSGKLIAALSGSEVRFYERDATSYLIRGEHPIIRKENLASLYFSELTRNPVSTRSMSGEWVEESGLILEACNTDWLKWNYQGEDIKTARVYRSEREAKNPGNVLVQQSVGKGELIASCIDLFESGIDGKERTARMIRNLGGKLKGKKMEIPAALNKKMELEHALFSGPFPAEDVPGIIEPGAVTLGGAIGESYWNLISAGKKGFFDSTGSGFPEHESGMTYLSFWMYSPRSLTDLLIEPDMPRLDMHVESSGALSLQVNGKVLKTDTFEGLPLEKGWNHMLIRLLQSEAERRCKVHFTSTRPGFFEEMKTVVDR